MTRDSKGTGFFRLIGLFLDMVYRGLFTKHDGHGSRRYVKLSTRFKTIPTSILRD